MPVEARVHAPFHHIGVTYVFIKSIRGYVRFQRIANERRSHENEINRVHSERIPNRSVIVRVSRRRGRTYAYRRRIAYYAEFNMYVEKKLTLTCIYIYVK